MVGLGHTPPKGKTLKEKEMKNQKRIKRNEQPKFRVNNKAT